MSALIKIDNELRTNASMQNARANQAATDALKMQSQQLQIPPSQIQKLLPSIHCTSQNLGGIVNTNCNYHLF